jgi:hypothetical protein
MLFGRLSKRDFISPEQPNIMEVDSASDVVEDQFDFNFGNSDVPVTLSGPVESVDPQLAEKKSDTAILVLVLRTMEIYVSLLPSILSQSSIEMLRMLDDLVQWPTDCSITTAGDALRAIDTDVLGCMIRLLRQATLGGSCRWFGSMDDSVKQMTQLLVAENWVGALKRSHLAKLALLCVVSDDKSVVDKATSLIKTVLITSGMFDGHGSVDSELHGELQGWCDLLLHCGGRDEFGDSLLLITSVIQFAFHWNGPLSSSFLTGFRRDSYGLQTHNLFDVLLPFSPVMFCFACLIGNNLSIFEAEQPKHIRCYIESISPLADGLVHVKTTEECEKFFQKFRFGAAMLAESLLIEAVFVLATNVRHPVDYLSCFIEVLNNISVGVVVEIPTNLRLMREVSNCKILHGLFQNAHDVRSVLLNVSSGNLDKKQKSHEAAEFTFEGSKTFDKFSMISRSYDESFSPSRLSAVLILHLSSIVCSPFFLDPSKEVASHPVYIFAHTHWHFLSLVHMTMCDQTFSIAEVLEWAGRNWEIEASNKLEGFQERSLFFSRSLDILRAASDHFVGKLITDVTKTPKKRSLCDSIQETSRATYENLSEKLCAKIVWMVQKFMKSPNFWDFMQSSSLLTHFVYSDMFGQKCREVLCAAAVEAMSLGLCVLLQQKAMWMFIMELIASSKNTDSGDESVQSLKLAVSKCVESVMYCGGENRIEVVSEVDYPQLLRLSEIENFEVNVAPVAELVAAFLQKNSFDDISSVLKTYQCSDWYVKSQCCDDGSDEVYQALGAIAAPSFHVQLSSECSQVNQPFFFSPISVAENSELVLMDLFGDELSETDMIERVLRSRCPQMLARSFIRGGETASSSRGLLMCYIVDLCRNVTLSLSLPKCTPFVMERIDINSSLVMDCIMTRFEMDLPHTAALKASFSFFKLLSQSCTEGQEFLNTFLAFFVQNTPHYRRFALSTGSYLSAINVPFTLHSCVDMRDCLKNSWLAAFTAVMQHYLKSSSDAISVASHQIELLKRSSNESNKGEKRQESLELMLSRVRGLMMGSVPFNCQVSGRAVCVVLMNKWVRSCLRHGFKNILVLRFLCTLIPIWNSLGESKKSIWFDLVGLPMSHDSFASQNLLSMVVGHSMFQEIILDKSSAKDSTTRSLLLLLLSLVSHVHSRDGKQVVATNQNGYLANVLLMGYSGTMSQNDRISLRILSILEFVGLCPSLRTVSLCLRRPVKLPVPVLGRRTSEWIFDTISPPVVYATLSRFPIWRGTVPLHFPCESDFDLFARQLEADSVGEWKDPVESFYDVRDGLLQCSEDVYDPCYFMPAIFHTLGNHEISIRQLANCGGLSLILVSLSSFCSSMRSYALASLQLVYGMLKRQTPDKDPAFRERAQILQLLGFVKNSFVGRQCCGVHEMSLTMGMFLGHAAMNLMQPNHNMFCKVNKYILSRPFCDPKDVPLFDLLVVNGDTQIDQSERLVVLRLMRDGLLNSADHINLCRKNGYNRLMLLFPLLVADTRVGHSILDILERGLIVRLSARYLIERCNMLTWVQSMMSPVINLKLTTRFLCDRSPNANSHNGGFSKYLIRYMYILRRLIWAVSLLAMEGECSHWVADIRLVLSDIVEDVISAYQNGHVSLIPMDVFRLLVLCMWDVALLEQELSVANCSWPVDVVERMSMILDGLVAKTDSTELDDINFSLLSLLSFKPFREDISKISTSLMCKFVKLSIKMLLPDEVSQKVRLVLIEKVASILDGRILPKDARKIEYFNASQYKSSLVEFDTRDKWDYVWTTYAKTDSNMNSLLPSTLGCKFILSCYLQVTSMWSGDTHMPFIVGAVAVARDLVLWSLFFDRHSASTAESPQARSVIWATLSLGADLLKVDFYPTDFVLSRMMCVRMLQSVSQMRKELLIWLSDDMCDYILSVYHDVAATFRAIDSDSSLNADLMCRVVAHISALISFHGRLSLVDCFSEQKVLDVDIAVRRVLASIAPVVILCNELDVQLNTGENSKPTSFWKSVASDFKKSDGCRRPDFGASMVSSKLIVSRPFTNLVLPSLDLIEDFFFDSENEDEDDDATEIELRIEDRFSVASDL